MISKLQGEINLFLLEQQGNQEGSTQLRLLLSDKNFLHVKKHQLRNSKLKIMQSLLSGAPRLLTTLQEIGMPS
jgi:hypothetical protein